MQMKRNTATLLTTILPMALSLCFITVPAQACAGGYIIPALAIVSLPVAIPCMLFAFFGLRRTHNLKSRLWKMFRGLLGTIALVVPCWALDMDLVAYHQGGLPVQAAFAVAPIVIPTLYMYLAAQPEDSAVGRRWAVAKNVIGIFIVFAAAMSGGVLMMLRA